MKQFIFNIFIAYLWSHTHRRKESTTFLFYRCFNKRYFV